MTGWLLDTNVLSELRRPRPAPQVAAFVAGQPLDLLFVSTVTLAEIRFGIELIADANRRAELNGWLTHKVRPMFDERILPSFPISPSILMVFVMDLASELPPSRLHQNGLSGPRNASGDCSNRSRPPEFDTFRVPNA